MAEANRRLRRELGASPWELRLPQGKLLRSGDVIQAGESVCLLPAGSAPRPVE